MQGNEENIQPFISNYELNLFDYHAYDSFEQFHTELQSVFEFLRYSGDRKLLGRKLEENRERYGNLSSEAKALLVQLTNTREIPDVGEESLEKGEFDMCKAFEDMKEEGRLEGRIEGIAEGKEYTLISQVCKKLKKHKTLDEIAEDLEEETDIIAPIYHTAKKYAPDYNPESVFTQLNSMKPASASAS